MGATVRVFVIPKHRIDELTLSNTGYQWFIDYCYAYNNYTIEDNHVPVYVHCENALTSWLSDSQPGKQALSMSTPIWILHTSEINEHVDLLSSALNEDMKELIVRGYSEEVYDYSWRHMETLAFMLQIRALIEKYPDYYIVIDAQW